MNRRRLVALAVAGTAGLVLALGAGVVLTAPNTALPWSVFGAAGGSSSSANYAMGSTAGQSSPPGESASPSYKLGAGFWYGVGGPPPTPPPATPTPTSTPITPTKTPTPTNTPVTPTTTPTATTPPGLTPTATPTPGACIDRDGDTACRDATNDPDDDGCTAAQEAVLGTDPDVWYDVFDVPAPAYSDPTSNGPRNQLVDISDVLAVFFYVFADAGGPPNGNGVSYDSTKGMSSPHIDPPQNLVVGMMYDRSPGDPDPDGGGPFIDPAGPPNGVIDIADALQVLFQVYAVDCTH